MDPHVILSDKMCPKLEISTSEDAVAKAVIALLQTKHYCLMLGAYLWFGNACHPNITYAVYILYCFQANPSPNHWNVLLRLLLGTNSGVAPEHFLEGSTTIPNFWNFWNRQDISWYVRKGGQAKDN